MVHLLLLILLGLQRLGVETQNLFPARDDDHFKSWCRPLPPQKPNPELTIVQEPTSKYLSAKSQDFKPYRILFVYDQDMSDKNKKLIEEAAQSANDRFSPIVKGPVLNDVRLPQIWNSKLVFILIYYFFIRFIRSLY